jgi:hypothetical protein
LGTTYGNKLKLGEYIERIIGSIENIKYKSILKTIKDLTRFLWCVQTWLPKERAMPMSQLLIIKTF